MTGLLKVLLMQYGAPYIAKIFGRGKDEPLPADLASVASFFSGKIIGSIGALWSLVYQKPEDGDPDNRDACIADVNDGCSYIGRKATGSCIIFEMNPGQPVPPSKCEGCMYRTEGELRDE